jgi:hypothetical protein
MHVATVCSNEKQGVYFITYIYDHFIILTIAYRKQIIIETNLLFTKWMHLNQQIKISLCNVVME